MKHSQYNIYASWKEWYIGVNLISGVRIILPNWYYDLLETHNFEELKREQHLYNDLINGRFIVEDNLNEYSLVSKNWYISTFHNSLYRLTILPTLECNFNCWYCYETHNEGHMSQKTMNDIVELVSNIAAETPVKEFQLDWFGGEPLLYFEKIMMPLSKMIMSITKNNNIKFNNTITTNAALMDEEMIRKMKDINMTGFQITLDGYKDHHNKIRKSDKEADSYSKILQNINYICNILDMPQINLRINYTNKNIKSLSTIIDDIEVNNRKFITVCPQRVWQTVSQETEADQNLLYDELEIIKKLGVKTFYNRNINTKGSICYADSINQLVINFDGSVFKCTARDFSKDEGKIGVLHNGKVIYNTNYYKYNVRPPFDSMKCQQCSVLPSCLGVCCQKFAELGNDAIEQYCKKEEVEKNIQKELLENLYEYIKTLKS